MVVQLVEMSVVLLADQLASTDGLMAVWLADYWAALMVDQLAVLMVDQLAVLMVDRWVVEKADQLVLKSAVLLVVQSAEQCSSMMARSSRPGGICAEGNDLQNV